MGNETGWGAGSEGPDPADLSDLPDLPDLPDLAILRLWNAEAPWVPPGSVRWNDTFGEGAFSPLGDLVFCVRAPDEGLEGYVRRCLARSRAAGRPATPTFWVGPFEPAGLPEVLGRLGLVPRDRFGLLVRTLGAATRLPDPASSTLVDGTFPGFSLRRARTVEDFRAVHVLDREVFGDPVPSDSDLAAEAAAARDSASASELFWVSEAATGQAAAAGGVTFHEGARPGLGAREAPIAWCHFWGGETLPTHRRRGFYKALVAARLGRARERGARFAAVEANVETSMPLLVRWGFRRIGTRVDWSVPPGVARDPDGVADAGPLRPDRS